MKNLFLLFAIMLVISCTKNSPGPVVTPTPSPTPTVSPTPVVQGKWCLKASEAQFSPLPPEFDTSVACKLGERKEGHGVYYCKDSCPFGFDLADAKYNAALKSSILLAHMLDGSEQKFTPILPSPMPPVIPTIEVVEQADHSFNLK